MAFHSASVIRMPSCAAFMSLPRYEQGPPVASQIWSARVDLNFSTSAGFSPLKRSFTRGSAAMLAVKSPTTMAMPSRPPSRL